MVLAISDRASWRIWRLLGAEHPPTDAQRIAYR
jgi:hypothetical protein